MAHSLEEYRKSLDLAAQINAMKPFIMEMDLGWLKEMIIRFNNQAAFEQSAAVLNPRYNPEKQDLLMVQASTMQHLYNFIQGLKECDRLKLNVAAHENRQDEIAKLFT